MTREEAKKHYSISTSNVFDFDKFIDVVYNEIEGRTCENCKYIKSIGYPSIETCTSQYSDMCGNSVFKINEFGCNKFESK